MYKSSPKNIKHLIQLMALFRMQTCDQYTNSRILHIDSKSKRLLGVTTCASNIGKSERLNLNKYKILSLMGTFYDQNCNARFIRINNNVHSVS